MSTTTTVLTNGYVSINSVDISHVCDSITLSYDATQNDNTTFGQDTHINLAGLKNWTLTIGLKADFSAAGVDSQLFALVGAAAFPVEVRPVNSARSTSNPGFNGNATLKDYNPLGGKVGDLVGQTVNFVSAGTLSRATA